MTITKGERKCTNCVRLLGEQAIQPLSRPPEVLPVVVVETDQEANDDGGGCL